LAIIVDKVQKKKDIALACKELLVNNSMKDLTIAKFAKAAGVGKGTMYEYFENKEEIVFEIINIMMLEHNDKKHRQIDAQESIQEKLKIFYYIFYSPEDIQLRTLYKEFVSISLVTSDSPLIAFQTQCSLTYFSWFEEIIQEGIDKNIFIPEAKNLARGLFSLGEGLFISSEVTHTIDDVKKELDKFYDTLFQLLEVQK